MFQGYLSIGGLEIVNNARTLGYVASAGCSVQWLKHMDTGGLGAMLGDGSYNLANASIQDAPWFDPTEPASERFLGVYGLEISGIGDSTAEVDVVEGVGNGGVIGKTRHASKQVRIRAWLTGIGDDAVEIGLAWLRSALEPNACGAHGDACGVTDLEVLAAVPPPYDAAGDVAEWSDQVNRLRRMLHGVARISGPLELQRSSRGNTFGALVQFTITSRPFLYGTKRLLDIAPVTPITVQDTPFNLVPYPSAELAGSDVTVGQNLSPNPSVEVNATGYAGSATAVSGSSPGGYFASERSSDLAAEGSWSYRGRLLGDGSTAASGNANLTVTHTAPIPAQAENTRMSFSVWGGAIIFGGSSSVINSLRAVARFYTSAGVAIGSDIQIGSNAPSTALDGNVFTARSVAIPSNAASVRVSVIANVTWASSSTATNSDIRVYIDAVAPTIP